MTRRNRRLLFLSRDYGSVKTIVPVVHALEADPAFELTVMAPGETHALFGDHRVSARALPEHAFRANAGGVVSGMIDAAKPDLIVTGCSPAVGPPPETPEQFAALEARRRGIGVLSILDTWQQYPERFCEYRTSTLAPALVPDRLCVLDRQSKAQLLALGISGERIAVTHNPALDALVQMAAHPPGPPSIIQPTALNVLFVSQPLAEMAHERNWPFTQATIFNQLCAALPQATVGQPHRIIVWVHPVETSVRWGLIPTGRSDIEKIVIAERGAGFLAHADLLVTSHSTVMFEALYFGTPCISIRPGGRTLPPLVTEGIKLSRTFFELDALRRYLARFDPKAERQALLHKKTALIAEGLFFNDGAATARVTREIRSMLHRAT
jgi:hypothetical protein